MPETTDVQDVERAMGPGGNVIDPTPEDTTDLEVAALLENVLGLLRLRQEDRATSTRGRALAITKIEEAGFWLGRKD